jgi:hypothetical protein
MAGQFGNADGAGLAQDLENGCMAPRQSHICGFSLLINRIR